MSQESLRPTGSTALALEIAALRADLAAAQQERERFRIALMSIAKNSCCAPCREAGFVAQAALRSESRSPDGDGQRVARSACLERPAHPDISVSNHARLDNRAAGSEPADSHHIERLKLELAACEHERNLRLNTDDSVKLRHICDELVPELQAENARLERALHARAQDFQQSFAILRERFDAAVAALDQIRRLISARIDSI